MREDIDELRTGRALCPQRVLVTIWPLFMLKSNLTVHTTAYEAAFDQNYSIFGRGKTKEMQMSGTSETDHDLTFKLDFKSIYDEDKRNALLSYQLVDKKNFFKIPSKFGSIEAAIEGMKEPIATSWPCSREEELRWSRENSFQEATLPVYKCGPSHELSCALMMTISPWCLFINSTGCEVRLTSRNGVDSCLIQPNNVVMPFSVQTVFVMQVKIENDWVSAGNLYLNNQEKLQAESYSIPDEGSVNIVAKSENMVIKL